MQRKYFAFVSNVVEDEFEHEAVINYGYMNKSDSNSMELDIDQVYKLQYETDVLDIINEENYGMLQVGENDWIIESTIKINILYKLKKHLSEIENGELIEIVSKLIKLFELSISTQRNIYFIF